MLDKTFVFKKIDEVLKEHIIPDLRDEVAKEQAIALISVLRNLDATTLENESTDQQVLNALEQSFNDQFEKLREDAQNFSNLDAIQEIEKAFKELENIKSTKEKIRQLNQLQCDLIQFFYAELKNNPEIEQLYINPLRVQLRKQLNIELAVVR